MKKNLLFLLLVSLAATGFSQNRAILPKSLRDRAFVRSVQTNSVDQAETNIIPGSNPEFWPPEETQIGETRYDNQSNASIPNRIYYWDDGTIGATWTRGMEETMFPDRGTGYNYYDGSQWDDWPETRVENVSTNRPTYTRWGDNGEIIVAHTSGNGLLISTRPNKGTGLWNFQNFAGPAGQPYILWNRVMTSGENYDWVHILALTLPTTHGGTPYEGIDGALLYSLSIDGGTSWIMQNEILDGMTASDYSGFEADSYAFAESKGDVVAFVVGGPWYDLFLMKSTDGGQSFEKTVIWQHPYPLWTFGTPTDTFYCADGAFSPVIDNDDMVHVAFGINRVSADADNTYWYPFVGGIGYWNENRPPFSSDMNALSPYGDPGSELIQDYNLIGWSQDINGNGQLDFLDEIGFYYLGLSSMPQLIIDNQNRMFLVFSSVTETYDNGVKNYRHLWERTAIIQNGENFWSYDFLDLTSGLIHIFDECVYPSCAANSDDYYYLVYQLDNEPGTAVWGSQHPYVTNKIQFMKVPKGMTGINEEEYPLTEDDVSQNFPNPFSNSTEIDVHLKDASPLMLEISDMMGQKVFNKNLPDAKPGINKLTVDGSKLTPGVYFYTVKAGEYGVTKKMIIE